MQPEHQSQPPLPSEAVLAPHHVDLLTKAGIPARTQSDSGVHSVMTDAELPEEFHGNRFATTPALVFPWKSPGGRVVLQLRPDNPRSRELGLVEEQDDLVISEHTDLVKYVFPTGQGGVLNELRKPTGDVVLLVEGTKQGLAAVSYAPLGIGVYAMAGCWNWRRDGLTIEDLRIARDKTVVVVLDADASRNLDVYNAGTALAEALADEGSADVRFMRLAAGKKNGLDDVIAARPEDDRLAFLHRKIDQVTDPKLKAADLARFRKPADKKPGAKKADKAAPVLDMAKKQVEATDLDVADEFVATKGQHLRFDASLERWLTYHDGVWDPEAGLTLAKTKFRELIKNDIEAVRVDSQTGDVIPQWDWLACAPRINHVLHHASAHPKVHVRADQLDSNPWLWNAANCVINLEDGQPMAHAPGLMMTLQSPVTYDADAEAPLFQQFLREVLPNEAVRAYVQRVAGMAMIGKVREHIFPVFKGEGRNGKGTLIRLIRAVFGPYASGISKSLLIETKFQEHSTIVATLHRRRLATTEELSSKQQWNISSVKELTGGDTLQGRRMREDEFYFTPSHTLLLSTNARPAIPDGVEGAEAFWDRYREIPFDVKIENPDSEIEDRMMGELPGILNWMLDGLFDYLNPDDPGLKEPPEVTVATAVAKVASDPLHRFVDDELVVTEDADDTVTNTEMFDAWKAWCSRQRPSVPAGGINQFAVKLCKADSRLQRPIEVGKSNVRTWHGVRVTSLDERQQGGDQEEGATFYGGGAKGSASDGRGCGERSASESPTPRPRASAQFTGGAASDASDASESLQHSHTEEVEDVQLDTPSNHNTPYSVEQGDSSLASLADAVAHSVTSQNLASDAETGQEGIARGPHAWHQLLRKHASVVDPHPACSRCGTPQQPDPELGVFQLCPACTTGSLSAPEATP